MHTVTKGLTKEAPVRLTHQRDLWRSMCTSEPDERRSTAYL